MLINHDYTSLAQKYQQEKKKKEGKQSNLTSEIKSSRHGN